MNKCKLCGNGLYKLNSKGVCRECEKKIGYNKYKAEKDFYNKKRKI